MRVCSTFGKFWGWWLLKEECPYSADGSGQAIVTLSSVHCHQVATTTPSPFTFTSTGTFIYAGSTVLATWALLTLGT